MRHQSFPANVKYDSVKYLQIDSCSDLLQVIYIMYLPYLLKVFVMLHCIAKCFRHFNKGSRISFVSSYILLLMTKPSKMGSTLTGKTIAALEATI